jgi:NADH-quinone oxidoreductase subunit C
VPTDRTALAPEEALARVQEALGDKVSNMKLNFGHVHFVCRPENLVEVAKELRNNAELKLEFFTFLSGIDRSEYADEPGGLEVFVHLYSPEYIFHVNLHVPVDWEEPTCPSITGIFRGADWHERETAEMFGIHFEGHPRLVNIYLPEDFEGHPGLRSFKLPTRMVKEWPGAKDPEEAAAGGR